MRAKGGEGWRRSRFGKGIGNMGMIGDGGSKEKRMISMPKSVVDRHAGFKRGCQIQIINTSF